MTDHHAYRCAINQRGGGVRTFTLIIRPGPGTDRCAIIDEAGVIISEADTLDEGLRALSLLTSATEDRPASVHPTDTEPEDDAHPTVVDDAARAQDHETRRRR